MPTRWDWAPNWEQRLYDAVDIRSVLDKAGAIVEDGARLRAPVRTGRLRAAIDRVPGQDADGPHIDVRSPVLNSRGQPYGLFIELGTEPHTIRSRGQVFHHPGSPPRPYLRPALDDLDGREIQ